MKDRSIIKLESYISPSGTITVEGASRQPNTIKVELYVSPCGTLMIGSIGDLICLCDWCDNTRHHKTVCSRLARLLDADFEWGSSLVIDKAMAQLDEFFAGTRREFDVPLLLSGTAFQKRVWDELLKIPYGQTVSYSEIARRLEEQTVNSYMSNTIEAGCVNDKSAGNVHCAPGAVNATAIEVRNASDVAGVVKGTARAVRAVANAVGANAVSILVPCHRVVGSDGSLTGYAGGLPAKSSILQLEGSHKPPVRSLRDFLVSLT